MLYRARVQGYDGATWWLAVAAGLALGGAAVVSLPFALGFATVLLMTYAFMRSTVRAELVVGAFWIAFTVYETVFARVTVPGFFYPFYLLFLATIIGSLVRDGLRVRLPLLLSYAAFLLVVMVSFIGFSEPITFDVVQRLIAYLLGGLILLQFGSARGLWPVLTGGLVAAVVISGWVIMSAIEGGFVYRGDIEVDQNVVAFFVGFGVVIAACLGLDAVARPGRRGGLVPVALVLGVTLYASLLLASRGMALALMIALAAVTMRAIAQSPRTIAFVVVLVGLAGGGLLLPGGQGLLERFEGERIETGGSRLPIWEATFEAYANGDLAELTFGHGYDSSKQVVRRAFGSVTSTHNAFLQILYEFGLVGFALFTLLHVHLIMRSWFVRSPYGLVMFGLVWFLIGANFSTNAPDGFMYWTVLGLVLAIGTWGEPAPWPVAGDERAGSAP